MSLDEYLGYVIVKLQEEKRPLPEGLVELVKNKLRFVDAESAGPAKRQLYSLVRLEVPRA